MIEAELFDGTVLEFPDGTNPEVIQRTVKAQTQAKRAATPAPATTATAAPAPKGNGFNTGWDYLDNTGATFLEGAGRGLSALAGAPVDLVNNAPRLANLIPGVDGVGKISDRPFLGSDQIYDAVFRLGGALPEAPKPQDGLQRIVNRAGFEVGASAVPVGAALGTARAVGQAGVRGLPVAVQPFVEPAAANSAGFAFREASSALAAGAGAGIANEAVGNQQFGDNFWSDFIGSMAGVGTLGAIKAAGGAGRNAFSAVLNKPEWVDDVARQEVADRIINNSTTMQEQAARGGMLDTRQVVEALRRPSLVEEVIPGYQVNIGDRTNDPILSTFAFDQDARLPGAANSRRAGNDAAVNAAMRDMAPAGDPARFRAELEGARDAQIAGAQQITQNERSQLDTILQRLTPETPYAEDRGAAVRAGVANAENFARAGERQVWEGVSGQVDPAPLAQSFNEVRAGLPVARQQAVADLEGALGIPGTFDGPVDLQEITALRSRLTTAQRNAQRGPQPDSDRANIIGRYIDSIDRYMSSGAVPAETVQQLDTARGVTRSVNETFNRPGDPLAAVAATNEGRPVVPDSGVAKRFIQPDSGQASNIDRLLAQTDMTSNAVSVRNALRDEMKADIQQRGLIDKPEQLDAYLAQHSRVFERFPDLRDELSTAGQTSRRVAEAAAKEKEVTRDLTTPGRSATAGYLKFDNDTVGQAIRSVTTSPRPREAVKELLGNVGDTPKARQDLRAALWEEVKRVGPEQAPGLTGEQRWNGKRLRALFDDPKFAATADELWADNPQDLANIKQVFAALSGAEGSIRARAAGSSGTAQSLSGKFDAGLTPSSIASGVRSVNRGQISPGILGIELATRWLRRRSAQINARGIDILASAVVNNPGMAADLLEAYNPATAAARRAMLTQKYGVRGTQVANILDEALEEENDPVKSRIMERR